MRLRLFGQRKRPTKLDDLKMMQRCAPVAQAWLAKMNSVDVENATPNDLTRFKRIVRHVQRIRAVQLRAQVRTASR